MRYLLDTNCVLYYLKYKSDPTARKRIDALHLRMNPFEPANEAIISVVTHGELISLGYQRGWGELKLAQIRKILSDLITVDVPSVPDALTARYAEIDSFSQGKNPAHASDFSARNMGKNDLWIAATASITGSILITSDNDFDHLDPVFLKVEKV